MKLLVRIKIKICTNAYIFKTYALSKTCKCTPPIFSTLYSCVRKSLDDYYLNYNIVRNILLELLPVHNAKHAKLATTILWTSNLRSLSYSALSYCWFNKEKSPWHLDKQKPSICVVLVALRMKVDAKRSRVTMKTSNFVKPTDKDYRVNSIVYNLYV